MSHNGHNAPQNTTLLQQLLSQDGMPSQIAPDGGVAPSESLSEATGGFTRLVSRLPQAKELFIAAGILLGPAGYLVKARYLAPYGLVPPVEFHLQYIVDGILFMLFCAVCLLPTRYAMDIIIQRSSQVSINIIFRQLLRFSKDVLLAIILIITALVSLTGLIVVLPNSTPPSQLTFADIALQSAFSSVAGMLAFAAIPLVKHRRNVWTAICQKEHRKPLLWLVLSAVAILGVLSCFMMLFMMMFNANVVLVILNSLVIMTYVLWLPLATYLIMVSTLFFTKVIYHYNAKIGLFPPSNREDEVPSNNVLQRYAGAVGFWSVAIALLVSFYALNVYPEIPQAIGGGRSASVTVLLDASSVYHSEVSASDTAVFISFRTSEKTFLRLDNRQTSTSKIIEVPNADIKGITYLPPTP